MTEEIKSVGVIGAGTMGQGIAQVCAVSGFNVSLFDIRPEFVTAALQKIAGSLQSLVEKGKLQAEEKNSALARISPAKTLADIQCDVCIEAAAEDLAIKRKIFAELESAGGSPLLVSNTSSIPITQIAATLKFPERFAGLHFFNPAPVMKLVEIIKGVRTSDATILALQQFCAKISKQSVLAQDSPGFIVNRVARHFYVESLKILEENVTSFQTVDALMRSSGFKMGPFELMDLIGVDVNFAVTSSMYNSFHQDPKFRPNRIQQQKVEAGQHGRKSGKGFYDYSK